MKKRIIYLITLLIVIAGSGRAFAKSCGCEVSDRKEKAYDKLLNLTEDERAEAVAMHLPWGIPKGPADATNEHVLYQEHFIINYDDDLRVPLWVAYRLSKDDVSVARDRLDCFRSDPRLSEEAASKCKDYDEPIFDRGHLVPTADMKRTEAAMINTCILSNITPQHEKFNQMVWKYLEGYVRDWAKLKGEIYVVSGAIFDKNKDDKRDADEDAERVEPLKRVAVPTHFYKTILFVRHSGYIENIAFVLPHKKTSPYKRESKEYLKAHLKTIDYIEKLTGVDFFPDMTKNKQDKVESNEAKKLWPTQ